MKKSSKSPMQAVAPSTSAPASRRCSDTESHTKADSLNQKPAAMPNTSLPISSPVSSVEMDPLQASAQQQHQPTDEQKRASRMQLQWKDAMCKNMEIPEGYAQVAVLIIEWADHLDQLNTRREVEQLKSLFRDEFYYEVETISLREENTVHQLRGAMSRFLEKYDRPDNLLVVYYTAHSRYNKNTSELEFWSRDTGSDVPFVRWKSVERTLMEEVTADTLAILDTCFASNFTKGGAPSGRAYQVLAACGYDKYTAAPGADSFTAALMASLKKCLQVGNPFTVWALMDRINKMPYRRKNPAQLHDRLGSHVRQILLAPLNRDKGQREQKEQRIIARSGIADLTLRFNLAENDFTKEHIEELTRRLPVAFKESGLKLCRIELDGFEERRQLEYTSMRVPTMAVYWGQQWLKRTRKHSEASLHRRTQNDVSEPNPKPLMSSLPSPAEVDEETSEALVAPLIEKGPVADHVEASRPDLRFFNLRNQHPVIVVLITLTMFNAMTSVYSFLR